MPTYLYFCEDEFFLNRAIKKLRSHNLDQQWVNLKKSPTYLKSQGFID
ncbi:MAG: hypothetical protein ACKPGX_32225 [Dolichospermum sp.]